MKDGAELGELAMPALRCGCPQRNVQSDSAAPSCGNEPGPAAPRSDFSNVSTVSIAVHFACYRRLNAALDGACGARMLGRAPPTTARGMKRQHMLK